jgi:peptidoglycan hydrolase CwlO-like protein
MSDEPSVWKTLSELEEKVKSLENKLTGITSKIKTLELCVTMTDAKIERMRKRFMEEL